MMVMPRSWIIRFAIVGVMPLALAQLPPSPPAVATQPTAEPGAVSIKWSDVCRLSVDDGKVVLQSDLTLEQLRAITPDMAVDGIDGKTTILTSRRSFLVRNRQETPGETLELTISATSSVLSIEMQVATQDESHGVLLYQIGAGVSQRSKRGLRLTLSGQETLTWEGTDLTDLRARAPHVVNRHLRPALQALKADLLQIDPAVARQVLLGSDATDHFATTQPATTQPATTQPAMPQPDDRVDEPESPAHGWPASTPVDPKVMSEVAGLIKQLDRPAYRERAASAMRLAQIGPPAATIIARLDRSGLSSEQNLALDLFMAAVHPLDPEAARRARRDPHFLLDCLYVPDRSIRTAAAEGLTRILKQPAKRFEAVAAMDPVRNPREVATAIEDLRDGLAPPQ